MKKFPFLGMLWVATALWGSGPVHATNTPSVVGIPPSNDLIEAAEVVTAGVPYVDTEPNIAWATVSATDPAYPCKAGAPAATDGHHGIWYRVQPPEDIRMTVSTADSTVAVPPSMGPDTIVAVFHGSPGALTMDACNDDDEAIALYSSLVSVNLYGGSSYWIFVSLWSQMESANGDLVTSFSWSEPLAPENDDISAAENIPMYDTTSDEEGQIRHASASVSDPVYSCGAFGPMAGNRGIWYTVTSPATATLSVTTEGSTVPMPFGPDTLLAVYTGSPGSLTEVGCNDDNSAAGQYLSSLSVSLSADVTYYVHVSLWQDPLPGAGFLKTTFSWSDVDQSRPANDDFVNATVLSTGAAFHAEVSKIQRATTEDDDPGFSCKESFGQALTGFHGVWYRVTPTDDVTMDFSTAQSTLIVPGSGGADTLLGVYTGAHSNLTEVACNDDIDGFNNVFASRVVVPLDAGVTYLIQVAQWNVVPLGTPGKLVVDVSWTPRDNDLVSQARRISKVPYTNTIANAQSATTSPDDPNHSCRIGGAGTGSHTRWWQFTPTSDGSLDLSTAGSTGSFSDTVMSVFTGQPGALVPVGCNDNGGTGVATSSITDLAVTNGTSYLIGVSRAGAATGTAGSLTVSADFTPAAVPAVLSISITSPKNGAVYAKGAIVKAAYRCSDDQQGVAIASCVGSVGKGARVDTSAVGSKTFKVTVTGTSGAVKTKTSKYTVAMARPDLQVRVGSGKNVGNDVYGTASSQAVEGSARSGRSVDFDVTVQNDARFSDRMLLAADGSANGYKVVYSAPNGTDITNSVLSGKFRTPVLVPGARYVVTATVTVTKKAAKGSSMARLITATSMTHSSRADSVQFVTSRR